MRTKALILGAAALAAGVASSMAQSNVYSLNIVGYVNLTVQPGYNLITLPLQGSDPSSSINSVLTNTTPVMPAGSFVSTWDPVHSTFNQAVYAGGDGNWYDASYSFLVTNSLPPGQGFFLNNASSSPVTVTVVGSVLTGSNSYPVNAGFNFYGNFVPVQGDVTTNGLPVVDNSYLYTWNAAAQKYNSAVYGLGTNDSSYDSGNNLTGNPAPYPVFADSSFSTRQVVSPAVGQGFLYFNAGPSVSWTQNFSVQ
jgi:hypothetical protein